MDKEIRANQRFRSKSQSLRQQDMWQPGNESQVLDDVSVEGNVAICDWFIQQVIGSARSTNESGDRPIRGSTHIASRHASRLTLKMDAIWLFKRSITSLSSSRKAVSGTSRVLKAGNGFSKIHAINLSMRHVARENHFSRALSV